MEIEFPEYDWVAAHCTAALILWDNTETVEYIVRTMDLDSITRWIMDSLEDKWLLEYATDYSPLLEAICARPDMSATDATTLYLRAAAKNDFVTDNWFEALFQTDALKEYEVDGIARLTLESFAAVVEVLYSAEDKDASDGIANCLAQMVEWSEDVQWLVDATTYLNTTIEEWQKLIRLERAVRNQTPKN